MTRDIHTLKTASNLLQEAIPDLVDLTYHYATSAEAVDVRNELKRRLPQQPFHTSLYRYLAQLLQALRSLPSRIGALSEKALVEKLLLLLDLLEAEFLCPAAVRTAPNDKSSWWKKKKDIHLRLYRTLGAWLAEGLHVEADHKLQWLIDSTRLGLPDSTSARQLLTAVKDSVHEVEAQVPLNGRRDQDDEHEMVPIPYGTWKLIAEVCRRMERVYQQLSRAWQCTCNAHKAGLHFAINPCISSLNSFVQASVLHTSDGWRQTWLSMKTTEHLDCPDYSGFCHDLHTSAQTTAWYEVLGSSGCHQPLSFDQFCLENGHKPLPRDRICLALLVAHLYLHLGGGGWWPYSRVDRMIYFHNADPSTGLFHPPIFRLDSTNADGANFLARCANPGMPNLALFGQLLLEIVTWESCTADGAMDQRLKSLRDNRTDLAHSNRILMMIMVCTGLDGSDVLKAAGADFTIRKNENSRRKFIELVIRNLEYVLLKGYQVDATDMFAKAFSPCGVCTAASRTDMEYSTIPGFAIEDVPSRSKDVRNQESGHNGTAFKDDPTIRPALIPRSVAKEDHSTVAGAERPVVETTTQQMAHRCQQEDVAPHELTILNDDTGHYETIQHQYGRDASEWLKKLAIIQVFVKETSSTSVKVAILDTGVSFHEDVARDVYEDRCEAYCFLDDPENPRPTTEDEDGHGTHMASIIMDISQSCKLYSARVFRSRQHVNARHLSKRSTEIVAKAIYHAVDEWKVNIISMSFGFLKSSTAIRDAIKHATSKGVIVLAAAGNSGSREPVRFPASDKNVICVHAVDGKGTAYCGNPNRQRNKDGFALLGVAVEGYTPGEQRLERRSGTSQATATACGIAAMVLQIMGDSQQEAEQIVAAHTYASAMKALQQTDGMKAVFAAMCDLDDQGHVYDNVEPWKLVPGKVEHSKVLGLLCYNIIKALSMLLDDG